MDQLQSEGPRAFLKSVAMGVAGAGLSLGFGLAKQSQPPTSGVIASGSDPEIIFGKRYILTEVEVPSTGVSIPFNEVQVPATRVLAASPGVQIPLGGREGRIPRRETRCAAREIAWNDVQGTTTRVQGAQNVV